MGSGASVFGFEVNQSTVAMLVGAILNTLFIGVMNVIYRKCGVILTDWENHRTDTEYENSLIYKNSIFQAVNSYTSFFYIAFAKPQDPNLFGTMLPIDENGTVVQAGSATHIPGAYIPLLDECNNDGDCMRDLVVQMIVVVIVKSYVRNLREFLGPCFRMCCFSCTAKGKGSAKREDELSGVAKLTHESGLPSARGIYWEYNEMAIQFGYCIMFAAAAPWASTLCLLNNAFERKADAMRMLYGQQRPVYLGASNIGAWASVFEALSFAAIVSNIAILGVTSDSLREVYGMDDSTVLWLCLILEHAIIVWKFVVAVRVKDAPLWVLKARAYQEWLVARGEEDEKPKALDAALLQAAYDDDDDLERFFL